MGTRQQPVPPPSWWDAPAFVAGGAEFARLDLTAVRFVLEHWVWARTHSTMWGPGLVAHHNWLKFCVAEDAADDTVAGVTFDGAPVHRGEWA